MPSSNLRYAQGPRSAASVSIATPNPTLSAESDIARPAAGPHVEGANAKQHPVGARAVQTILERSFLPGAEEAAVEKAPSATKRFINAVMARRFLKIGLGIGLVVAFGWAPLRAAQGQRFQVTAKGGDRNQGFVEWTVMRPFMGLLVLSLAAVLWAFYVTSGLATAPLSGSRRANWFR
jgi:hypothetical protein